MGTTPNRLSRLWQELKRRNVFRVVTVYTGAAFVILSLVDMIREPFELPNWSFKLVVVILSVGLIIAVILSWIYDIHPDGGMVKTETADKIKPEEPPRSSRGWKVASYISFVVILGLIVLNVIPRTGKNVILDKSIAVLPFHNFSGDPSQDYICYGLTDEIIGHLFKITSFDEVRSLTTVVNFKDSDRSVQEIAEMLHVNYILEGTYKRIGDKLRVTAQLIEGKSDKHIWQQDYDLAWREKNTIPADIALQIADHLKTFLTNAEKQSIQEQPASEEYVLNFWKQARLKGADKSTYAIDDHTIDLALEAIELESDYSQAYALLGGLTLQQANYGGSAEMYSSGWKALTYIEKALELNPDNGFAHGIMGTINEWFIWDYVKAEKEYLRALELLPDFHLYWTGYGGEFLVKMNRLEDAAKYTLPLQRFTDDPFYFNYQYDEIRRLIIADKRPEAYQAIERFLEMWGEEGYLWAGSVYTWLAEYDTALYYLKAGVDDPEINVPLFLSGLALAYNKTGHYTEAIKAVQQLKERSDTTTAMSPAFFLGWYYSGVEELDSAFMWLEKAYRNRSSEIPWFKVDPGFNNLKNDERYWDLYERTGHKAYDDYMASKKE
jgi:TolB-like protein